MLSRIEPIDLDGSPQQVYARLIDRSTTVLLESAKLMPGLSGWSYISGPACATLETREGFTVLRGVGGGSTTIHEQWHNPFDALRSVLERVRSASEGTTSHRNDRERERPAFAGGLIGFLGYDLVRYIERLPTLALPHTALPDMRMHLSDHVLAFDHARSQWYFCTTRWSWTDATERSRVWAQTRAQARSRTDSSSVFDATQLVARTPDANYLDQVRRCKEYIADGHVFQVNLSRRLEGAFRGDPFGLYARLTAINPAPFAAYVPGDGFAIASVSPERFLKLEGGTITARPIKGTRPRGADVAHDEWLRRELQASEKDLAENLMIVDLMRNDLGRVARTGSVRVEQLFEIEAHPSVWQMVSTIRASLRADASASDLLRACWPPGSMTGAPKVRAMEIIEELEPMRRGPYAGAIGYIDTSGAMDLSVVIRTAVISADTVAVQLGGAIVADSQPEAELAETQAKGRLLLQALRPRSA